MRAVNHVMAIKGHVTVSIRHVCFFYSETLQNNDYYEMLFCSFLQLIGCVIGRKGSKINEIR